MKNQLIYLLALVAILILSGCIGGTQDNLRGYPGVLITDFSPMTTVVRAGSPVNLYLTVQNQGYADATNVNVKLFNCGPASKGTSSGWPFGIEYNCNNNLFQNFFALEQPNPDLNKEGDVKDAEIILKTTRNMFPAGRTSQTFTARLSYDYETKSNRDIFFTTYANWKEKGGAVSSGPLNEYSAPAPLSLSINAPAEPIVVDQPNASQENQQEFTVGLSIRNTGSGFVQDKTLNSIELCYDPNFIVPKAEDGKYGSFGPEGVQNLAPGEDSRACLVINQNTADDETKGNLALIGLTNQYKDITVRFQNKGNNAIKVQDVTGFDAKITYTYLMDSSTTVNILNG